MTSHLETGLILIRLVSNHDDRGQAILNWHLQGEALIEPKRACLAVGLRFGDSLTNESRNYLPLARLSSFNWGRA